jgi:hypothetical protein
MSRTIELTFRLQRCGSAMPCLRVGLSRIVSKYSVTECSAQHGAPRDLPAEQRERDRHLHIVVPVDRRRNRLDDALADARVLSEGADRVFIFLCQPER